MILTLYFLCLTIVTGSCVSNVSENPFFTDDGILTAACPFTNFCTKESKLSPTGNKSRICCESCMCSTNCHHHGNCCPDVQHEADDNLQKPVCYFPVFSPDEKTLYDRKMNYFSGIHSYNAFVSCPVNNTKIGERNLCEERPTDLESLTLVSDSMGYVYKNKYCAECHGKTSYKSWNLKIQCATTDHMSNIQIGNSLKNIGSCMIWSLPPDPSVGEKSLCYNARDACNVTGDLKTYDSTLENKCESYTLYYFYNIGRQTQIYKNVHCLLCNIEGQIEQETCTSELVDSRNPMTVQFSGMLSSTSFSIMRKPVQPKCRKRCTMWQLYDPLFNTCRKLTCEAGSKSFYGECLSIYKNTFGYSLSMLVELTPVLNQSTKRDKDLAYFDFPDNYNEMIRFAKAVAKTTNQYKNKCTLCSTILTKVENATNNPLKVLVTFHTHEGCDINSLYQSAYVYALNKERIFSFRVQQRKVQYKVSVSDDLTLNGILDIQYRNKATHLEKYCGLPKPFTGDMVCPRITLNASEYRTFLKRTNMPVPAKQKLRLQTTDNSKKSREQGGKGEKEISNELKISYDYDICSYHYMLAVGKCDRLHNHVSMTFVLAVLCFIVSY